MSKSRHFAKLSLFSLLTLTTAVCLAQQTTVSVDGEVVKFENAQPQIIDGTMFVPLRGVFEQMRAEVKWDEDQHMVAVTRGDHQIQMRVEGKSAMVDNRAVNLTARCRLIHGSLMVPLRFIATAIGCQVSWEPTKHNVEIQSDGGRFISRDRNPAIKTTGGGLQK